MSGPTPFPAGRPPGPQRTAVALLGVALVVAGLMLAVVAGLARLEPASRSVSRTYAVQERLDRFQAGLARLEAAAQLYVATGRAAPADKMGEEYRAASADFDFIVAQARDHPAIIAATSRWRAQLDQILALQQKVMRERVEKGGQSAWGLFLRELQPVLIDLTQSARTLRGTLDQDLTQHTSQARSIQDRGRFLAAAGAGLGLFLAGGAFLFWHRQRHPVAGPDDSAAPAAEATADAETAPTPATPVLPTPAVALRSTLAQSPALIWAVDRKGTYTLHEGNVHEATGLAPGEAVGRAESDVMKDSPQVLEFTQRALSGEAFTAEFCWREHWYEAHYLPLRDAAGEITGVSVLALDITARRAANQQALADESTREANRLQSEFLASMGHEIRTPMNGIVGMAGLLQATPLSDEQRGMLDVIEHSVTDLLSALNNVLDLSKLESGKLALADTPLDLQVLVEDILAAHSERARAKGLELINDFDVAVPAQVRGDESRLRQVITNLVNNALKFTERGHVVVRVRKLPTPVAPGRLGFRLEVVDTGIGLAPEAQEKLLRPFMPGEGAVTRTFGGTGFGLALAKQLVDLMAGRIGLTSTPGKGSTFWIELELPSLPNAAADSSAPALGGTGVLVIDDNDLSRGILALQLSGKGASVDVAESSQAAITRCMSQTNDGTPYDVIVVDRYMPGMDGLQFARAVRAQAALAHIPLVLLSPDADPGAGVPPELIQAATAKPVRVSHLLRAIHEARQLKKALQAKKTDPASNPSAPTVDDTPPPTPLRLLLVEDNAVNQKVAALMLKRLGHEVVVANHGGEALEKLAASRFDAVLMDCHMPVMDGYEATQRIRASGQSWSYIPIIAVTANNTSADQQRCRDVGMDDFVAKPINAALLERALTTCSARAPMAAAA